MSLHPSSLLNEKYPQRNPLSISYLSSESSPSTKNSDANFSWRNRSQHSFLAWARVRSMSLEVTSSFKPLIRLSFFSEEKKKMELTIESMSQHQLYIKFTAHPGYWRPDLKYQPNGLNKTKQTKQKALLLMNTTTVPVNKQRNKTSLLEKS